MKLFYPKYLSALDFISDVLILNFLLYAVIKYTGSTEEISDQYSKILFVSANLSWMTISQQLRVYSPEKQLVLKTLLVRTIQAIICQVSLLFGVLALLGIANVMLQLLYFYGFFFVFALSIRRMVFFYAVRRIRKNPFAVRNICLVGDESNAIHLIDLFSTRMAQDYKIVEFVSKEEFNKVSAHAFAGMMKQKKVKEIIVCFKEHDAINLTALIEECGHFNTQVKLFLDILSIDDVAGVENFQGIPLIALNLKKITKFKPKMMKRSFDIIFSGLVMIPGLPVFVILAIITKLTSHGPIFYKQLRLGRHSRPFFIYKFRSMYMESEKHGPQLAKDDDPRVTPWGKIMRKTRLDELPQFWNVFKGDMSVVGPRPERQHYVDQIVEHAPDYKRLLLIKPGITSVGQIEYGYAENVEQMCNRLQYDLRYLSKMRMKSDLNIILSTVKVMIQARGK